MKNKKNLLCNFLNICNHVGYKVDQSLYEEFLFHYKDLSKQFKFSLEEKIDFIVISILSKNLDTSLSKEMKVVFYEIISDINSIIENRLTLNFDSKIIKYYPTIPSEDKHFSKSLSNLYINDNVIAKPKDLKEDDITEPERKAEENKSYMRKSREGRDTIDVEFQNYFIKKKEFLFGNENYVTDDFAIRQILKKWSVALLFKMKLDDQCLQNNLNKIFSDFNTNLRASPFYQKVCIELLSFGFIHNFTVETDYVDPATGIKIDFLLEYKGKKFYLLIVPQNNISKNIEKNVKIPDGCYSLLMHCIKRYSQIDLITLNYNDIETMNDGDYHQKILNMVLNY
jgi:hypothetical protein